MALPFGAGYVVRAEYAPSTLAADTVFFALKNTSPDKVIALRSFQAQLFFVGTNASSRSAFALQRVGGQSPTGGNALTPTKLNAGMVDAEVEVRSANAGLANITPGTSDRFFVFGVPSQITAPVNVNIHFEDENPFLFIPGEALILVAHTAAVAGVQLAGNFIFYQYL